MIQETEAQPSGDKKSFTFAYIRKTVQIICFLRRNVVYLCLGSKIAIMCKSEAGRHLWVRQQPICNKPYLFPILYCIDSLANNQDQQERILKKIRRTTFAVFVMTQETTKAA